MCIGKIAKAARIAKVEQAMTGSRGRGEAGNSARLGGGE
jgi:hypothetical protein